MIARSIRCAASAKTKATPNSISPTKRKICKTQQAWMGGAIAYTHVSAASMILLGASSTSEARQCADVDLVNPRGEAVLRRAGAIISRQELTIMLK